MMTNQFRGSTALYAGLLTLAVTAVLALPAHAQRQSAQDQRKQKTAEIPTCAKPLGTLSVLEPEDATDWWTGQQLPAPSKLIKVFVSKSRCFTLVDRGAGLDAARRERDLGASGELRNRCSVGKGQMKAADYVMTPDLISRNSNAGGNAIGGILGGIAGYKLGKDSAGGAAIGALVGGVVGRMIGQYMDDADKKRLAETIDAAPSGQTVSWHNDDTGRDFAVTPTSDFYADAGKECRSFDQVVYVDGRREVMEGVACRTPGDDSFDFSGQSA